VNNPQIYLGVKRRSSPATNAGWRCPIYCMCKTQKGQRLPALCGTYPQITCPQINLGVIHRVRLPAYRNAAIFRTRLGKPPCWYKIRADPLNPCHPRSIFRARRGTVIGSGFYSCPPALDAGFPENCTLFFRGLRVKPVMIEN
jgi:hypothetical protein